MTVSREHFDHLSRVADRLGVPDPFDGAPTGGVDDLRAAARAWRGAADRVESSTADVNARIGAVDDVWRGRDCDAFVAHVQRGGRSGGDVADSMRALADGLDRTAEAVHAARAGLAELAADTAGEVTAALAGPADGACRARRLLAELAASARKSTESTEEAFRDFGRLCADLAGEPAGRCPGPGPAAAVPASDGEKTPSESGEPLDAAASELSTAVAVGVLSTGVLGGAAPPRGRRRNRSRARAWELLGGPDPGVAPVLGPEQAAEPHADRRPGRVERALNPPTAAPESPAQQPVPPPDAGIGPGTDSAPPAAGEPRR
ncbi:WXG100-like domain-containing protein [Saccharopolyspora rosea]|uniref:WXG100-like domain-containing protein n=1 Tax=Saccharopolyspora rosea TaxID=524884 RepID=UPI0021DA101C|nr:hypothetical protein [Saccharopolyspora rosea]